MLGLLVGGLLPVQADFGIALPVSDPSHAQIHAHLAALAIEVGLQLLKDDLLVLVGNVRVVLDGFGIDAVLVLGSQLTFLHHLELGAVHMAHGALEALRNGLAFVDITADGANKFLHNDILPNLIFHLCILF